MQIAWILFCMVNMGVLKTIMQWVWPLYCMVIIRQYTVIQMACNSVLHGKYVGLTVMQWVWPLSCVIIIRQYSHANALTSVLHSKYVGHTVKQWVRPLCLAWQLSDSTVIRMVWLLFCMAKKICGSTLHSHAEGLTSVLRDNCQTVQPMQMVWRLFCMINMLVYVSCSHAAGLISVLHK